MKPSAERTILSYFLLVGNCLCINVQFKETRQHYLWQNMQVLLLQKRPQNNERAKPLTYKWFYMYRPSECLAVNGLWMGKQKNTQLFNENKL